MRGVLGRRRGCCASCHGASPKVSAPSGRSVRSAGCARSSPSARGGARVPPLHHPHQHSSRRRPREVCRVRCTCSVGVGRRGPRVACAVPAAGESAVAHGRRRTGLFLFSKFTFHLAHRSLRVGQCCSPRIPDSRLTLSRFARPQKSASFSAVGVGSFRLRRSREALQNACLLARTRRPHTMATASRHDT